MSKCTKINKEGKKINYKGKKMNQRTIPMRWRGGSRESVVGSGELRGLAQHSGSAGNSNHNHFSAPHAYVYKLGTPPSPPQSQPRPPRLNCTNVCGSASEGLRQWPFSKLKSERTNAIEGFVLKGNGWRCRLPPDRFSRFTSSPRSSSLRLPEEKERKA